MFAVEKQIEAARGTNTEMVFKVLSLHCQGNPTAKNKIVFDWLSADDNK